MLSMFSLFGPCFLWNKGAGNSLFCAGKSEIHAWTGTRIHLQKNIIHDAVNLIFVFSSAGTISAVYGCESQDLNQ